MGRGQVVSALLGFERSQSVKHRDFLKRLPLHIACATPNKFSGELAKLLCRHFPGAAKLEDGVPAIPIEYAVDNPSPTAGDVVAAVLKEFPEGVVRVARHGDGAAGGLAGAQATVIHKCASAAFINRDPGAQNILQWLVRYNRDAAGVPDRHGRTPLHLAVENVTPAGLAVVRMLTEACPGAVNVQDRDGNTPLHVAAAHCNLACIDLLVRRARNEKQGRKESNHGQWYIVVKRGETVREKFETPVPPTRTNPPQTSPRYPPPPLLFMSVPVRVYYCICMQSSDYARLCIRGCRWR
jgi:hypothetical protein